MGPLKTTLSASFVDDEKVDGEWDRLLADSSQNSVFLSQGWLQAWLETIGGDFNVILAKVRLQDALVAAAAFQERNGVVEFAGKGRSDYSDFIVSSKLSDALAKAAIAQILSTVGSMQRRFSHFFLGRIPADSTTHDHLTKNNSGWYPTRCQSTVAPCMEMTAADEKLKKKSLRRHERALQRLGQVSDVTFTRAKDILPLLDTFFEQHISRWENTASPSLFLNPVNREFYRRFIQNLDPSGWLRFTILKLDDRIVAAHCGFLSAGKFTWYKPTFDIRLQKLSPGEVLIKRLIERAKAEAAVEFDFTIGGEAFKHRFATKIRQVVYVHLTDSWPKAAIRRARVFLGKNLPIGKSDADKAK